MGDGSDLKSVHCLCSGGPLGIRYLKLCLEGSCWCDELGLLTALKVNCSACQQHCSACQWKARELWRSFMSKRAVRGIHLLIDFLQSCKMSFGSCTNMPLTLSFLSQPRAELLFCLNHIPLLRKIRLVSASVKAVFLHLHNLWLHQKMNSFSVVF